MKLIDIYMHLQDDMTLIEEELEATLNARHSVLREASTHLLKAGGKRIRPVFVLLAGKFGNYDANVVKDIAVTLELIHMGSLVHDDVIDDAQLRRGKPTIKAQYDNRVAMYTGDYIFAKALEIASNFDDKRIHQILSTMFVEMSLGEVEQIKDQYAWNQTFRQYLRRIKRKTALLIAISCELGAIAANAPKEIQRKLHYFGYYVGMSFQITDDVLDFIGTEKQLGKPAGSDLFHGNITLPVLYAFYHKPDIKKLIMETLDDIIVEDKAANQLLDAINMSGGIEFSLKISDLYLQKAYSALQSLPDIEAKKFLWQIAEYIGTRKF